MGAGVGYPRINPRPDGRPGMQDPTAGYTRSYGYCLPGWVQRADGGCVRAGGLGSPNLLGPSLLGDMTPMTGGLLGVVLGAVAGAAAGFYAGRMRRRRRR